MAYLSLSTLINWVFAVFYNFKFEVAHISKNLEFKLEIVNLFITKSKIFVTFNKYQYIKFNKGTLILFIFINFNCSLKNARINKSHFLEILIFLRNLLHFSENKVIIA